MPLGRVIHPRDRAALIENEHGIWRRINNRQQGFFARDNRMLRLGAFHSQARRHTEPTPGGNVRQHDANAKREIDLAQEQVHLQCVRAINFVAHANADRRNPGPRANNLHAAVVAVSIDIDAAFASDCLCDAVFQLLPLAVDCRMEALSDIAARVGQA